MADRMDDLDYRVRALEKQLRDHVHMLTDKLGRFTGQAEAGNDAYAMGYHDGTRDVLESIRQTRDELLKNLKEPRR